MHYGGGMTVGDLKEQLEMYEDDVEVRLMTQPSWPFEYSIDKLVALSDINQDRHTFDPTDPVGDIVKTGVAYDDALDMAGEPVCKVCGGEENERDEYGSDRHSEFEAEGKPSEVVYLTEGSQLAYGTKQAWEVF